MGKMKKETKPNLNSEESKEKKQKEALKQWDKQKTKDINGNRSMTITPKKSIDQIQNTRLALKKQAYNMPFSKKTASKVCTRQMQDKGKQAQLYSYELK